MKKRTKKLLIGSGIFAVGFAAVSAVSHALTNYLVKVALDREQPKPVGDKAKAQLMGSEKIGELMKQAEEEAQKLEQAGCRQVEITAQDGITLIGHLHTCENAKRTIIAMHGWRSSWSRDFGLIADFWHGSDCNVLYAEQRGQGGSGGDYMGFGMLERYDCLAWINWINENGYADIPIYLCGVSMGAATVLMTAGFALPQNVCGIVADCAFISAQSIWKHVMQNNIHLAYSGVRSTVIDDLCKKKIQVGPNEYSTLDAMKVCSVPVLFIHGTDDHFVPVEMTYENYKACTAEKRLFVVPGADHGMSYYVNPEEYKSIVKKFWADHDNDACASDHQ